MTMPIAHYLTLVRLFLGPIFFLVYQYAPAFGISNLSLPFILAILLGLAELSDAFDGYLARKYNQVTDLGKILDPMADSIYRITIFLTFTLPPVSLPVGLVLIFLYRDSLTGILRTLSALKGVALAARPSGKIKAIVQAVAAFCVLGLMLFSAWGWISVEEMQYFSCWIVGAAGLLAIFSGIEYIVANSSRIQ